MEKRKSFEIRDNINAGRTRIDNSASPLCMQAITPSAPNVALKGETHDSLGAMCLPKSVME